MSEDEKSQLINRIEKNEEKPDKITLGGLEELHDEAMHALQILESFFGLHGVEKIHWNEAEREFIPETPKEEEEIDVLGIKMEREWGGRKPTDWELGLKDKIRWDIVEDYKLPLSFHRRAKNFYDKGRFIDCYINCYFILEGFYAEGEFQKAEQKFLNSEELIDAAETRLPQHLQERKAELKPFFDSYNKEMTVEGFLKLFVVMRHQLHHYFHDHEQPHKPDYFEEEMFQPLSLAILDLVFYILLLKSHPVGYPEEND